VRGIAASAPESVPSRGARPAVHHRGRAFVPGPQRRSALCLDSRVGPLDVSLGDQVERAARTVPSIVEAKSMPFDISHVSNDALYILAEMGQHDACWERLVRNVMAVDEVDWVTACDKVSDIDRVDRQYLWLATLPYKVGIFTGLTCTLGALPMVFHRPTVEAFNEIYVTTDVPEEKDLETALEVGNWAWNWMEPPMGTIGFMILSMQLVRAQMQNMGWKPYTHLVKSYRADRLARLYPQYNADVVREFSQSMPLGRAARPNLV